MAVCRCIVLLLSALMAASSMAQRWSFSNYAIEQGLSQSVVNCVFQDSKGFIWAGTQNGLNRFDGFEFRVFQFRPDDTTSLSNNWIYAICEDRSGNLWIGTKGGLNQWIRKENRFRRIRYETPYGNQLADYIYDLKASRNGSILINTPPVLSILDPEKGTFRHYTSLLAYDGSVKDNRLPLLEDSRGIIWTGSTKGLAFFDPKKETFGYGKPANGFSGVVRDNITALYEDRNGNLWIGTGDGLKRWERNETMVAAAFSETAGQPPRGATFIRAITGDAGGKLWIGTEGSGLFRATWDPVSRRLTAERFSSEQQGVGHNIILDLAVDRSMNLWIGTLRGLSRTDLKARKFRLWRRDDTPGSVDLSGNVIASLSKDDKGRIWAGTWGQGLNIIDRKTGKTEQFSTRFPGRKNLPNDFVHVIFSDPNGNTWLGTRDGIVITGPSGEEFVRLRKFYNNPDLPDFRGIRINAILKGRDGSYWIGTQEGLYRLSLTPATTEFFRAEADPTHRISGNLIYSLLEDRHGRIWIATLNGLDVYDPADQSIRHFRKIPGANSLCDNFVISLCEDHRGNVWIGTGTYVNRYDPATGQFTWYSSDQGLPDNRIFEILEDGRKQLWFATGNGLARLDTLTGRFRTFTTEEGLQSMEFNLRACHLAADGEVFFGGMNGFNSFYPDSLRDNPFVPQVVLTSFYKTFQNEKSFIDIENLDEVVLNPADKLFTIEFAALEFTNPSKNSYAYLLEGVSDEWVETGNRRFVPFSNLPPGEYVFRVKASNNDGVWNEAGPALKIVILPPWWQSTIAYIAWFMLAAGTVFLFIRLRERSLLKERNLLEKKVHERTLQIEEQSRQILAKNEELSALNSRLTALNNTRDKFFSIIAHDLRNPFNTILGLSDLALSRTNPEEAGFRKSLSDIRDTARHTFDLLQNLLLWARSQTGALEYLPAPVDISVQISEALDLVRVQAEKKGIGLTFTDPGTIMVDADIRMTDTILRNLLTNAIKFTPSGGTVSVSVERKDPEVTVSVTDTGIGMDARYLGRLFQPDSGYIRRGTEKERGTGLGLMLCREFVDKHGGEIGAESEPGKGSRFWFRLPVAPGTPEPPAR